MTRSSRWYAVAVLLPMLGLVGCATAPPPQPAGDGGIPIIRSEPGPSTSGELPQVAPPLLPPVEDPLPPVTTDFPKSLAAAGAGAPVLALARLAETARAEGRHDVALGHWQRALRIEPGNAFIWHEIAETQLALRRGDQADSAARKSTSVARGNLWLEMRNWRLIAAARRLLFDSAGAAAATAKADALRDRLPP